MIARILAAIFGPPPPELPVNDAAVQGADSMMQAAEAGQCVTLGCRLAPDRIGLHPRCIVGCRAAMERKA